MILPLSKTYFLSILLSELNIYGILSYNGQLSPMESSYGLTGDVFILVLLSMLTPHLHTYNMYLYTLTIYPNSLDFKREVLLGMISCVQYFLEFYNYNWSHGQKQGDSPLTEG